jgi:hypothetical protein
MVWLFNGAGRSVFAASLYHTTQNVSWQLYPVSGSFEDPMVSGLMMAALALAITAATRGRLAAARPSLTAPAAPV